MKAYYNEFKREREKKLNSKNYSSDKFCSKKNRKNEQKIKGNVRSKKI